MSPGNGVGTSAVIEPPDVSPTSLPRTFSRLSAPPLVSTLVSPLKLRTAIAPPRFARSEFRCRQRINLAAARFNVIAPSQASSEM